jgi:hypothetical protein
MTDASNNRNSGKRKVMMNFETWKALSTTDQNAWDGISDDGKRTILQYVANRASNGNGQAYKKPQKSTHQRAINTHDLIFDDDEDEVKKENGGSLEVGTHSSTPSVKKNSRNDGKPETSLLHAATHKTSKEHSKAIGISVNKMLSNNKSEPTRQVGKHEINVGKHEITVSGSNSTREICMREINYGGTNGGDDNYTHLDDMDLGDIGELEYYENSDETT